MNPRGGLEHSFRELGEPGGGDSPRTCKMAEECTEVLESTAQYRAIVSAMRDGVVMQNDRGEITAFNSAACSILGLSADQLLGRTSLDPAWKALDGAGRELDGNDHPAMVALRTGQVQKDFIMQVLRPTGDRAVISVTSVPIYKQASAEPHAVLTTFSDITERRLAEARLEENQDRLRAVMDGLLAGLVIFDRAGTIEDANPRAGALLGCSRQHLIGQNLVRFTRIPPGVSERDFLRSAHQKALGQITEWEVIRMDGSPFSIELSMYAFESPKGERFAAHFQDISARRQVDRMKSEFVSTVSHELRTPLTSIRGALSLLPRVLVPPVPEKAQELLQLAERNTLRLIGLVNDILDIDRLEQGGVRLELQTVPAAHMVTRSVEAVRTTATSTGIRIDVRTVEAPLDVDPARIEQVLINLLSNAIKFSKSGGSVILDVLRSETETVFSVTDQGRGIPRSHHEQIFERFHQVDGSDSRKMGGTGLGLAICKALVELHGGRIGFESEEGEGSRFWFSLPNPGALRSPA